MYKHFSNYYWKSGKPYGKHIVSAEESPISYKIVVDPYFRQFSVEKYRFEVLESVVYDSLLLDFRHLAKGEQIGWRREMVQEMQSASVSLLRNQDDRAVLIETLTFTNNYCSLCEISSVLGVKLATHRMYYQSLGDSFNGVVLYDNEQRVVMMKTYEWDKESCQFTTLLKEEWDMSDCRLTDCKVHHTLLYSQADC